MSEQREVHRVLKAGLEHLQRYGWVPEPGFANDRDGTSPACMIGALHATEEGRLIRAAALCVLAETIGIETREVADWNDRQKSFAPVEAAYCRAIEVTAPESQDGFRDRLSSTDDHAARPVKAV